jgi:hypothetical protein
VSIHQVGNVNPDPAPGRGHERRCEPGRVPCPDANARDLLSQLASLARGHQCVGVVRHEVIAAVDLCVLFKSAGDRFL